MSRTIESVKELKLGRTCPEASSPFVCWCCNSVFKQKRYLRKHLKGPPHRRQCERSMQLWFPSLEHKLRIRFIEVADKLGHAYCRRFFGEHCWEVAEFFILNQDSFEPKLDVSTLLEKYVKRDDEKHDATTDSPMQLSVGGRVVGDDGLLLAEPYGATTFSSSRTESSTCGDDADFGYVRGFSGDGMKTMELGWKSLLKTKPTSTTATLDDNDDGKDAFVSDHLEFSASAGAPSSRDESNAANDFIDQYFASDLKGTHLHAQCPRVGFLPDYNIADNAAEEDMCGREGAYWPFDSWLHMRAVTAQARTDY